jgi:hypothetical protein
MPSRGVKSRLGRWLAAALLITGVTATSGYAQHLFYDEVEREGQIHVFAKWSRYDAFVKSDGTDVGQVITRPGYGPNGETVVFDSVEAIALYNFRHGLPAEPPPSAPAEAAFPAGKISGLMFGDYYWYYRWHQDQISSTNPIEVQGQHGFWFRRLYFTYDYGYSERLRMRFRLEANSNGEFEAGDIVPYVKDAYVRWTYSGDQQLTLGIQPTLTFDWLDGFWSLRHIEKTPADLYRLDGSRDFAFTFYGPVAINGLSYAVQFGNESGNGSETQHGKILRFETRYDRNRRIALEGFYSIATRPEGEYRHTAQAFTGFRNPRLRLGLQYLWQEREPGDDRLPDQAIDIWSGFAVWDVRPKKADLFFRVDAVKGDIDGVETGLPDAGDIEYWLLSDRAKFVMWIAGGEWFVNPSVRLSPNVEIVRYAHDPDPVNFPGRRQDSILRLTFFWTF